MGSVELLRISCRRLLAGLCAWAVVGGAWASYPERPITLVVPFTAGGGTDLTARLLARAMEKHGGQSVTVLNRAGAGGEIGMAAIATAAPDGYTLGVINTPNALTIPIERAARFSLDSFALVANIVDDPGTLSVRADSAIRSVQDLVAAARRTPDTLTYGTAGIGSAGHISMLQLEKAAGIRLRHVPYKGTADVRSALLGGQIDVATANLGEALGFAQGGQPWRILGQMAAKRSPMATQLPTFGEAGFPVEGGSLRGIGAPKGVTPDLLKQIQALVAVAANDPEFRDAARKADQDVRFLQGDEYVRTLKDMQRRYQTLWGSSPWHQ